MLSLLRTIRRLFVIAGFLAGSGCVCANAQQAVKLRVATISPPGSFFSDKVLIPFLERVKADAAGTFDYQVYPSGTLGAIDVVGRIARRAFAGGLVEQRKQAVEADGGTIEGGEIESTHG